MRFKRFWVIFRARNYEFFRDKSGFGWNILFPFLIVAGFGLIFSEKQFHQYKVGVFPAPRGIVDTDNLPLPSGFFRTRYLQFIGFSTLQEGLDTLRHHKIDFLLKTGSPPHQYWVSDTSPKGYIVERIFMAGLTSHEDLPTSLRGQVQGRDIRYIDWLLPGILSMNMMFSALWGVGYVVVRYRKNGVLKRLKATPLTAFEYLTAQMLSRIFILMFSLCIVWVGCDLLFSFTVAGSYVDLVIIFFIGGLSLTALGLLLASRGISEEFTSGVLNFISWPMMFLSEVWFSIEGAPRWVKHIAQIFPLTHMTRAIRKIMNDGARLIDVLPEITALLLAVLIFLGAGAWLFSWNE